MAYQQADPFWDFVRSFDPNTAAGANAASSNNNNDTYPAEFIRGFPLFTPHAGPGGPPHHHGRPGREGRGRRHGPPPHAAWAGPFGWGDWTSAGPEGAAPWFIPQQQQHQEQQRQQQEQQEQQRQQQERQREQHLREQRAQQERHQATAVPVPEPAAQPAVPQNEKPSSPDTMMGDSDAPDPAEVTPDEDSQSESNTPPRQPRAHCRRGRRNCNREDRRSSQQQQQQQGQFPFDLTSLLNNLSSHPFVQNLQAQAQPAGSGPSSSNSASFSPPLDLFSTPAAYTLHLSLPGALKPDVGVDWDPERQTLRVAGVVHRPGDEAFQASLVSGERRVGVFEREVKLPPAGVGKEEQLEVDADGITARMEDGVLVVTVPKVEREWTEIRKVDIE